MFEPNTHIYFRMFKFPLEKDMYISYINSYNYDINLEKEIDIKDVFNSYIDYMEIIAKKIDNKINI